MHRLYKYWDTLLILEVFKFTIVDETDRLKAGLKILILGAYKPESEKDRLILFKNCLIKRKFIQTCLVADFPNATYNKELDIDTTKKSEYFIIYWADVLIFVFFKEGKDYGVTSELRFTCDMVPEKAEHALVLFEDDMEFLVGTQVRGPIKITKMSYNNFDNDVELCNHGFGHCVKVLDRLLNNNL